MIDIHNSIEVFVDYGEAEDAARNGVAQDDIPHSLKYAFLAEVTKSFLVGLTFSLAGKKSR